MKVYPHSVRRRHYETVWWTPRSGLQHFSMSWPHPLLVTLIPQPQFYFLFFPFLGKMNIVSPFLQNHRRMKWENVCEIIQDRARCISRHQKYYTISSTLGRHCFSSEFVDMVSKWLINDCSESISLSFHLLTFCKGRQTGLCQVLRPVLSKLTLGTINSTCSSEVRNRSVSFA